MSIAILSSDLSIILMFNELIKDGTLLTSVPTPDPDDEELDMI